MVEGRNIGQVLEGEARRVTQELANPAQAFRPHPEGELAAKELSVLD
jgi:hypothetical protein